MLKHEYNKDDKSIRTSDSDGYWAMRVWYDNDVDSNARNDVNYSGSGYAVCVKK